MSGHGEAAPEHWVGDITHSCIGRLVREWKRYVLVDGQQWQFGRAIDFVRKTRQSNTLELAVTGEHGLKRLFICSLADLLLDLGTTKM